MCLQTDLFCWGTLSIEKVVGPISLITGLLVKLKNNWSHQRREHLLAYKWFILENTANHIVFGSRPTHKFKTHN